MDFAYQYTEEQEEFRKDVRSWLAANVPDDMRAPVDRMELSEKQYWFWRDMHKKLADKGWLFPTYPAEYGGGGLGGECRLPPVHTLRGFTAMVDPFHRSVLPWHSNDLQRVSFAREAIALEDGADHDDIAIPAYSGAVYVYQVAWTHSSRSDDDRHVASEIEGWPGWR